VKVKPYYYLTPVLGGLDAPRYPIDELPRIVGRAEEAAIPLLEPTVSREHATISLVNGQVILKDHGSKHGTFVNSKRITQKVLNTGDIVVFGLSLVLRLEESDEPVPLPAPIYEPEEQNSEPLSQVPRTPSSNAQPASAAVDEAREVTVKLRKLATLGGLVGIRLPMVHQNLANLADLAGREEIELQVLAQRLVPLVAHIESLLDEAHVARPQLDPADLLVVCKAAVEDVNTHARERDVRIVTNVPSDIIVLSDAFRLQVALTRLLENSLEASPPGGQVELDGFADEQWAYLSVTDQGRGIPAEVGERLFDPFITSKQDWQHVGLGLFEARQTIGLLGGRLELDSDAAQGASFRMTLPKL